MVPCPSVAVAEIATAHLGAPAARLAAFAAIFDRTDTHSAIFRLATRCLETVGGDEDDGTEAALRRAAVGATRELARSGSRDMLDDIVAATQSTGASDDSTEGRWIQGWLAAEAVVLAFDNVDDPWGPVRTTLGKPRRDDPAVASAVLTVARHGRENIVVAMTSAVPGLVMAAVAGEVAVAVLARVLVAHAAAGEVATVVALLDAAAVPPPAPDATWRAVAVAMRSGEVPLDHEDLDELANDAEDEEHDDESAWADLDVARDAGLVPDTVLDALVSRKAVPPKNIG